MHPILEIFGLKTSSFNLCISLGALVCVLIFCFGGIRFSVDIFDFTRPLLLSGLFLLVGGKLLSLITVLPILLTNEFTFVQTIEKVGFVFYGGLIGTLIGLKIYTRRHKRSLVEYTDTYFRLLPIGQAFGRIGCYLNGCCYGVESNSGIAILFPVNDVLLKVIPTQLIEAGFCLILGVILLKIKLNRSGAYTMIYLLCYPVFRFMIEFFRGDLVRGIWGGLSVSQWISISILMCVSAWIVRNRVNGGNILEKNL